MMWLLGYPKTGPNGAGKENDKVKPTSDMDCQNMGELAASATMEAGPVAD